MTVILTLFGCMVFVVSCFTAGFKTAFKRLMAFAVSGLILDVLIVTFWSIVLYCH